MAHTTGTLRPDAEQPEWSKEKFFVDVTGALRNPLTAQTSVARRRTVIREY